MNLVRLLPPIVSLLVLGAHFLRRGNLLVTAVCLGLIALLAVPRRWVAQIVRFALLLGGVEWVRTLIILTRERESLGEPWSRMALILGAVALVTLASTLVFLSPALKRRYSS